MNSNWEKVLLVVVYYCQYFSSFTYVTALEPRNLALKACFFLLPSRIIGGCPGKWSIVKNDDDLG